MTQLSGIAQLPGGRQAGDHGALDPLMPPAQPQEPLPGLAARPDHFQQHLDVARLQQQPQRLAAAPQAWQFDAPQPPLQQDASGNRRTDNPEGSSGGHQSTPQVQAAERVSELNSARTQIQLNRGPQLSHPMHARVY